VSFPPWDAPEDLLQRACRGPAGGPLRVRTVALQQNGAATAVPPSSSARMAMLEPDWASLREIATVLTEAGHRTKRAARWHHQTVGKGASRSA
jgi:hypothetical protein